VTINDVLPLKAAQRDAIANLKSFGASEHKRLNFDSFIYIRFAAPPYAAGTVIIASVYERLVETPVVFFSVSCIEVHEILAHYSGPFAVSNAVPGSCSIQYFFC